MAEISKEDLKQIFESQGDMVRAIVEEMRKPAPLSEQEQAQIEMAQEQRAATSAEIVEGIELQRKMQLICSHQHRDGNTHCTFVRENDPRLPGYILCQKCLARIRPQHELALKLDPHAIFDTMKFNDLFQRCATSDAPIID